MSTDSSANQPPEKPVGPPLSMREITALMVKHYDLHEGIYSLSIEFNIGVGKVGPDKESTNPGVMIGIAKIGLNSSPSSDLDEPTVVDAAIVNPAKKPRGKKNKAADF